MSDTVIAALIGLGGTVITGGIAIYVAWARSSRDKTGSDKRTESLGHGNISASVVPGNVKPPVERREPIAERSPMVVSSSDAGSLHEPIPSAGEASSVPAGKSLLQLLVARGRRLERRSKS